MADGRSDENPVCFYFYGVEGLTELLPGLKLVTVKEQKRQNFNP